jgi:hypothetical protein
MATKSAYKKEKPAEDIPTTELPEVLPVPSDDPPVIAAAEIESPQPESNAAVEAEEAAVKADEAALALKGQIEAARQAEEFQAQRQAAMAQHVPTREEKLEAWGLSEGEKRFLIDNPEMLDHDNILAAAIQTATRAGIDRSAPEFLPTVKQNFDAHLHRFQEQVRAESPQFFRPSPVATPSRPSPASFTSAPVSREASGDRPARPPSKITLTAEEKEASRIAGISELEYAKQKARLIQAKARGEVV